MKKRLREKLTKLADKVPKEEVYQDPNSWEVRHFAHLTCSPCKKCSWIRYKDFAAVCINPENRMLVLGLRHAWIDLYDELAPVGCPISADNETLENA